jgi:hypothetical protein
MKVALIAGAALAVTAAVTCAAAGRARLAPSTGSDVVLGLRAQPEGELRLQYRREIPGHPPDTVSLGIAGDYHYIKTGGELRIYDYKLRRIFTVTDGNSFIDDSLYAEVWLRAMRLTSEVVRARATLSAGSNAPQTAAAAMWGPFWMESSLGVIASDLPRPALAQFTNQAGIHWMLGNEEVAVVAYQEDAVPQSIKGSLRRFWPTFVQIHPQIAAALASSGRMPTDLRLEQGSSNGVRAMAHWTLTATHWEPAAVFPLPPRLSARPTREQGLYPAIFETLATLLAENRLPPSQATYRSKVEAAIDRGAGLEAMLWLIEMDLARGRPFPPCEHQDSSYCSMWAQATQLAHSDSRTNVAFMPEAPDAGDRSQFHSLPNAYLLRFLWVTRPPGRGVARDQSELDLLAALRASPVANFCKDAGVFYTAEWQPFAAWQAWDFGRAMAGHTWGDLLDSIDTLEADLVAREPELF